MPKLIEVTHEVGIKGWPQIVLADDQDIITVILKNDDGIGYHLTVVTAKRVKPDKPKREQSEAKRRMET